MKKTLTYTLIALLTLGLASITYAAPRPSYSHEASVYDCRQHANCENCKADTYCTDVYNNNAPLECYTRARFEWMGKIARDTDRQYGNGYSWADTGTQGGEGCCVVNDYVAKSYYGPGEWANTRLLTESYAYNVETKTTSSFSGVR